MSRNLCRTDCRECGGDVRLLEAARPGVAKDFGHYRDFIGMLVANAECIDCLTPYLAWVDQRTCVSPLYREGARFVRNEGAWFDLSYRHSFNDEPDGDGRDAPKYEVIRVRVPVDAARWWDAVPGDVCEHGRSSCAACAVHKGRAIPSTVMP